METGLTRTTGEGIDEVSNDKTADDANDSSEGDRSSRLAERDTADEDDGFHTLTEDGDQRQDDQSPFSGLGTAIDSFLANASIQPRRHRERFNTNFYHRKPPGA